MTPSSLAGVITAGASMFTALALVITAITGFVMSRRTGAKIEKVHVLVNQKFTDLENWSVALVAALQAGGLDVPADQSKPRPRPLGDTL